MKHNRINHSLRNEVEVWLMKRVKESRGKLSMKWLSVVYKYREQKVKRKEQPVLAPS